MLHTFSVLFAVFFPLLEYHFIFLQIVRCLHPNGAPFGVLLLQIWLGKKDDEIEAWTANAF